MKVYDNNQIKTYRSLYELANSNVLVGRKDGLIIGIDENTIQELRDTIDNNNYLHRENEKLNNIIDELEEYLKTKEDILDTGFEMDRYARLETITIYHKLQELKEGK